jgi:hypothetical protein
LAGLVPTWHDAHWQVWRVTSTTSLVEGPAHLDALTPDTFTVHLFEDADVLVRIRWSSHWDTADTGCIMASPEGWTLLRAAAGSTVTVRQVVSRWRPFRAEGTPTCPTQRAARR